MLVIGGVCIFRYVKFIHSFIYFKSGSVAHKTQMTEDRQEYTEYAVLEWSG